MIDPTWKPIEVTEFGGAITSVDPPDVPLKKSLQADNCVFKPGGVETRKGFGLAYDVDEAVTSMDNWVSNLGNYSVYHTADSVLINHEDNSEIAAGWTAGSYASYGSGQLTEDATAGVEHLAYAPYTATSGHSYVFYVDVKASGRTWVALSTDANGYLKSWFDISGGVTGTVNAAHVATITDLGNSWYRCQIQFTVPASGSKYVFIYLASADAVVSYNGDGSSGVYFEAAKTTQVASLKFFDVESPVTTITLVNDTGAHGHILTDVGSRAYVSLFDADGRSSSQGYAISYRGEYSPFSDDIFADWIHTDVVVTDDVTTDPDGGSAGDKITDTVANSFHRVRQNNMDALPDNATITINVYLKAAEHTRAFVNLYGRDAINTDALFDLSGGAAVYDPTGTAVISSAGSGWYLCSLTATIGSGGATPYVQIILDRGTGSAAPDHEFVGSGTDGIYAYRPTLSVSTADELFAPPLTYTPGAPTEPSAGEITAGAHNLAYAIQYRSGFIGRLCPDSGSGTPSVDTFEPVSFTSAGSKNLSWVLNTAWPDDAVKVLVAMTPVSNPDLYVFVPGAEADVTGGTTESHTITFDVTDSFLLSIVDDNDATNHRLWYTQTASGTGPFNPHAIVPYGDRMAYVTEIDDGNGNNVGAVFVSERNKHQSIAPDFSLVQLPGQIEVITAFTMNGALYILSPTETHMTSDNGLKPIQWPAAMSVGQIGTVAPRGVSVADGAAEVKVAFVAAKSGLYAFSGRYDRNPMSYLQEDVWNSINWDYAHLIQVVDIPHLQTVAVAVPLDDATSVSHILTWCYRKGVNYAQADYSKWSFSDLDIGALAVMKNTLPGAATGNSEREELWVAPSTADAILRQMTDNDRLRWRDESSPVATDLADSGWVKTASSVSDNAATDPDGGSTADKFIDSAADTIHYMRYSISHADDTTVYFTCYAKAAEHSRLILEINDKAGTSNSAGFDLSAGTVFLTGPGVDAEISSLGSGWYRCTISDSVGSGSSTPSCGLILDEGTSGASYQVSFAGNASDGVYVWGASVGTGIPMTLRTAGFPGAEIAEMQRHHGAHHRVTGSGTLTVKAKSIDGGWSKTLRSITLASAPDKNEWRPFHKMQPRTTYEYSHTAADAHALISGVKHYVSGGPQHR